MTKTFIRDFTFLLGPGPTRSDPMAARSTQLARVGVAAGAR